MKAVKLFVIGGTLGVLLFIPLRMYGTLNPCGWLKIELKQAMAQKATQINTTSDSGAVGAMLGLPVSPASMNQMVDAMQPDKCLKKLYQIKKVGGVEAYMKAQQEKQPSAMSYWETTDNKRLDPYSGPTQPCPTGGHVCVSGGRRL